MTNYQTNLTDNQWQVIEKFLDMQERKRKYPLRNIANAINYSTLAFEKTGNGIKKLRTSRLSA